jgi:hypothetical protein
VSSLTKPVARIIPLALLWLAGGCFLGNRPSFVRNGSNDNEMTYYLDGAGNFGFGMETVPLGLMDGGYDGKVEHFVWTTYMGPLADQMSTPVCRWRGGQLAHKIEKYLDRHPGAKVNIIGLSAGSGVAVFALEKLSSKYWVNQVIMLSSSLSADYDLTRALRHVRGGITFFWSPDDPILRGLVPLVGTVDGERACEVAGVIGARIPTHVGTEGRGLYQRVRNVRWYTRELIGPIKLQHAGTTDRSFVCDMVAPILVSRGVRREVVASPRPNPRPSTSPPQPTRSTRTREVR